MKYGKFKDGVIEYVDTHILKIDGKILIGASASVLAQYGIYEVVDVHDFGTDKLEDNKIYHYVGVQSVYDAIVKKQAEIEEYSNSEEVDRIFFNGQAFWFDKATRVGLMNSTTIQKNAGSETCFFWFNGQRIELTCEAMINILSAVEIYALECYNVTHRHLAEVAELKTIEEVDAFDITEGYPESPEFSFGG